MCLRPSESHFHARGESRNVVFKKQAKGVKSRNIGHFTVIATPKTLTAPTKA